MTWSHKGRIGASKALHDLALKLGIKFCVLEPEVVSEPMIRFCVHCDTVPRSGSGAKYSVWSHDHEKIENSIYGENHTKFSTFDEFYKLQIQYI